MQSLADASGFDGLVRAMSQWVGQLKDHPDTREPTLVGIRDRGDDLASRVGTQLGLPEVGTVDITLYRDDLTEIATQPTVQTTEIDFPVDGRDVVLIDDVLMSGRSVRAALSVLMDLGRPRRVWLAVLVDRGAAWRELPIQPDFAALTYPGPQRVQVQIRPTDDADAVLLQDPEPPR